MSSQHSFPFWRICLTKKNIGTRLASSVPNAGHLWLISNLDQKRTESIADHATTLSLQPDVTDVGMSSEQVQNEMAIFSKLCISDPKMCTISFSGMKKMEYKTRQWHEKCFVCCTCKNPIGTKSFIPKEHDIYCAKCYEDKFATKCIKCNKVNFILFFLRVPREMKNVFIAKYLRWQAKSGQIFQNFDSCSPRVHFHKCHLFWARYILMYLRT